MTTSQPTDIFSDAALDDPAALANGDGSRQPGQSVFTELARSRSVVVYRRKASSKAPLVWLSGSVFDVLGYTTRTLIENEDLWLSLLHRDYHSLTDDLLRRVRASDRYVCEYEILGADGEYRWIRDELRLVRDENDDPLEIVGCWLDLTPYREMRDGYGAERGRTDFRELELVADLMAAQYRLRHQSSRHRDALQALTQFKERLEASGARNLSLDPADASVPVELFDRLPGVAYRVRPGAERHIDYASRGFRGLIGLEDSAPAPSSRLSLRDLSHEDVRDANEQRIADAIVAGETYTLVYPIINLAGEERWVWDQGRGFLSEGRLIAVYGFLADVTDSLSITDRTVHSVSRDSLTGLANQVEFERHLVDAMDTQRSLGAEHVMCVIDVDQFSAINDAVGFAAGDAMLTELSDLLRRRVRSNDLLARLNADEFGLLVQNCPLVRALDIARSLCDAVDAWRFVWDGKQHRVSASIGVVSVTDDLRDSADLIDRAREACLSAKNDGRGRVRTWRGDEDPQFESDQITAAEALALFDDGRLTLYAQPAFPARASRGPAFFEMLLRYKDSEGQIVGPSHFMSVVERYGLLARLDRWVIRRALDIATKDAASTDGAGLCINLTSAAMNDPGFPEFVAAEIDRSGISPSRLIFEISEIDAVTDVDYAARFINEIKKYGCRFALDDFGGGQFSFAQLKQLPVDAIKIDGELIRDVGSSAVDRAMIEAIATVARQMGIISFAEAVEQASYPTVLGELGVDFVQGYALGMPAPLGATRH